MRLRRTTLAVPVLLALAAASACAPADEKEDTATDTSASTGACSPDELLAVADAGKIMPPKSTWFEPKLRAGLFVLPFDL